VLEFVTSTTQERIDEELQYAAHCMLMAEAAPNAHEHEGWGRLARHWLRRALDSAEAEFAGKTAGG